MLKKLLITTVFGVTLILNAEAIAKCEQGSHDSVNYIRKHYKNCTQCREEVIPAGKCAKVKGKHKHYYCMCDVCDDNSKNAVKAQAEVSSARQVSTSKAQKAQATTTKNEVIRTGKTAAQKAQAEVTSARQVSTSKAQKVQAEVTSAKQNTSKAQKAQTTTTKGVNVKPTPNEQKASRAEAQKTQVAVAQAAESAVAIKAEKVATKSSGSCKKQGSHTSIDWIKKRHKNCGNCGTQKGSKGETVYYCYCGDGCKNSSSSDLVAVPKKSLNLLKGSGELVPKK